MGRVFKYAEIQTNRIPNTGDFEHAADAFNETATEAVENGHLVSALTFGSVSGLLTADQGVSPGPRSDFDSVLVIGDYSDESTIAIRGIVSAAIEASNGRLPIEPLVYLKKDLIYGVSDYSHDISQLFGKVLTGPNRFIIGEDIADYIRFPAQSALTLFNSFIARKRRTLNDGIPQAIESEKGTRSLQQLLELPVALGREALLAMILNDTYPIEQTSVIADKKQVIQTITEELRTITEDMSPEYGSLTGEMNRLIDHDVEYGNLLAQACAGQLGQEEYTDALQDLADYRSGLLWLDKMHTVLYSRVQMPDYPHSGRLRGLEVYGIT